MKLMQANERHHIMEIIPQIIVNCARKNGTNYYPKKSYRPYIELL
jgi:hypothetical protein